MSRTTQPRKIPGMNVGSASLVMVFSVLCLTIFAVLSVVTARSEWNLAEKNGQAVTAYYEADSQAVEILDQITATYGGEFIPPKDCPAKVETIDGQNYLSYWVPIDENQVLWVQLYDAQGTIQVAHWEVEESGIWTADQTLDVWGG